MTIKTLIVSIAIVAALLIGLGYMQMSTYDGVHTAREIIVDAPPSKVWAYLTEPKKRANWVSGLVSVVPLRGTPGTTGSHSLLVMLRQGQRFELEEEVIGAEPPTWLGIKTASAGAIITTTFTLEPRGPEGGPATGTRLTFEQDTNHLSWPGKLFAPFWQMAAKANAGADLGRLKQLVESAPAMTQPSGASTSKRAFHRSDRPVGSTA